jgi:hypothetical protein
MEAWYAARGLSEQEMDTFVRLLARFISFDVDQFEHFAFCTPSGAKLLVDFNQGPSPYPDDAYREIWPLWDGQGPSWTVYREDENGARVEMTTYGSERSAEAIARAHEVRRPGQRYPGQRFWVESHDSGP